MRLKVFPPVGLRMKDQEPDVVVAKIYLSKMTWDTYCRNDPNVCGKHLTRVPNPLAVAACKLQDNAILQANF